MDAVVGLSQDGRSISDVAAVPSLLSCEDDISACSIVVFQIELSTPPRSFVIEAIDPITLDCYFGNDWSLLETSYEPDTIEAKCHRPSSSSAPSPSSSSSSPSHPPSTFPLSTFSYVHHPCHSTMSTPSASSLAFSAVYCLIGKTIEVLSSRGTEVNGSSVEQYIEKVGYFVKSSSAGDFWRSSWSCGSTSTSSSSSSSLMGFKENALVYSSGRLLFLFDGSHLKELSDSGAPYPPKDIGQSLAKRASNQVMYQIPFVYSLGSPIFTATVNDVITLARYAAFRVGNGTGKLPVGVTINQTIFDDHNQASLAVRAGIDIVIENRSIAVIGALTSSMSLALQNVLVTFGLPQLSPSATTPTLSDNEIYPTFTRIVSPANEKAELIVSLAVRFNWTKVYMISSSDEFASSIARAINDFAITRNVLIAEHVVVNVGLDNYDSQLIELAAMKPRIIFLMVGTDSIIPVIGSMYRVGINGAATVVPGVLFSVNTSTYTVPTHTPDSYLNGWMVVAEPVGIGPIWDSFVDEVQHLDNENAWPNIYKTVTETPRLGAIVETYDVMANAISSCLARAPQCDPENHQHFLSSLLATNTSTLSGNIVFDEHGDRPAIFELLNIWNSSMNRVARFDSETNLTFFAPFIWPDGTSIPPLAILPPELSWLKWNSVPGIVFTALAAIGILICIATIILVIYYRNSAAIRPATWSMLLVTLTGLTVGFVSSLMWIGKPSKIVCHLRFWLVPLAFALIFSPLVAKTWRIMMIFRKPVARGGAPKRLKYPLKELIIIVSVLVGIQVVICLLWSIIGSGEVITIPDRDNPDDKAWVTCARSSKNNIFAFVVYGYLGLMLLVGAYFAFRARHAWKLWNESAWIARTIYNALFFSLLAITLGYTLKNFPLVVNILIIVFILEICYVTYFMTFGPKLWMLWRHPDQRKYASSKSSVPAAPVQRPSSQMSSGLSHYSQTSAASLSRTNIGKVGAGKSSAGSSSSSASGPPSSPPSPSPSPSPPSSSPPSPPMSTSYKAPPSEAAGRNDAVVGGDQYDFDGQTSSPPRRRQGQKKDGSESSTSIHFERDKALAASRAAAEGGAGGEEEGVTVPHHLRKKEKKKRSSLESSKDGAEMGEMMTTRLRSSSSSSSSSQSNSAAASSFSSPSSAYAMRSQSLNASSSMSPYDTSSPGYSSEETESPESNV